MPARGWRVLGCQPACTHVPSVPSARYKAFAQTLWLYYRQEVCSSMCLPVGSGTHPCCRAYVNLRRQWFACIEGCGCSSSCSIV